MIDILWLSIIIGSIAVIIYTGYRLLEYLLVLMFSGME